MTNNVSNTDNADDSMSSVLTGLGLVRKFRDFNELAYSAHLFSASNRAMQTNAGTLSAILRDVDKMRSLLVDIIAIKNEARKNDDSN